MTREGERGPDKKRGKKNNMTTGNIRLDEGEGGENGEKIRELDAGGRYSTYLVDPLLVRAW